MTSSAHSPSGQAQSVNDDRSANLQDSILRAGRSLSHPDIKVALRADFPPVLSYVRNGDLLERLDQELRKKGSGIHAVGHINIAYPHKHPEKYRAYHDRAAATVDQITRALPDKRQPFRWKRADALCETVRLDRSENQELIHTLTGHQCFAVHMPSQREPLPFVEDARPGREFFIIADWNVVQGTTVNNMRSFIEHNGGHVLAVVSEFGGRPIAPRGEGGLKGLFGRVSGRVQGVPAQLVRLGQALSATAADKKSGPAAGLTLLDQSLRACGNSLMALTHVEVEKLTEALVKREVTLATLTAGLAEAACRQRRKDNFKPL
jgi:hypothetical protein